ncbi:MAG: hypothetical protein NC131_00885 [Roseburia sp.]|nr:hypothetical protein [Roseburia sp.]
MIKSKNLWYYSTFKDVLWLAYGSALPDIYISKVGSSYNISFDGIFWQPITKRLVKKLSKAFYIEITKDYKKPEITVERDVSACVECLNNEIAGLTGAAEAKQTDCDNLTRTLEEMRERAELAETQLRELLSTLYKQTNNRDKSFTLYQSDIVEIAKDCGVKL